MGQLMHQLRQEQALIYSVTTREKFRSKRAANHMPLVLTNPIQNMDCGLSRWPQKTQSCFQGL